MEAKRTRRDPRDGHRQAELYADCLEKQFGQRPVIFTFNGYSHWIWDNLRYPQREVQGFYKKAELELLIQRRTTRKLLAARVFQKFLPDSAPVNLVTERNGDGRFFVSTYATMSGLIDSTSDEERRFGVGHFDLLVIDEAHRSVFQKYRAIFSYFDSLLVGLTATPKDEVHRSTYDLFDLEKRVPTDVYGLDEAVKDKFLVPAKAVSVPVGFARDGIRYDDLSDEEREQWDDIDWQDDNGAPVNIDPEAVNKWLFNKDTVDKVLEHLMTNGLKVAGGKAPESTTKSSRLNSRGCG